jgi:RP/EB family microtubule-associated protein
MKLTTEALEKERDFYFGKLRDIEVLCQEATPDNDLVNRITAILYATEVNSNVMHTCYLT